MAVYFTTQHRAKALERLPSFSSCTFGLVKPPFICFSAHSANPPTVFHPFSFSLSFSATHPVQRRNLHKKQNKNMWDRGERWGLVDDKMVTSRGLQWRCQTVFILQSYHIHKIHKIHKHTVGQTHQSMYTRVWYSIGNWSRLLLGSCDLLLPGRRRFWCRGANQHLGLEEVPLEGKEK